MSNQTADAALLAHIFKLYLRMFEKAVEQCFKVLSDYITAFIV